MKNTEQIDKAFDFLREMAEAEREFTLDDLATSSGWSGTNPKTNVSKKLSEFLVKIGKGRYRADPIIQRVKLKDFRRLFAQSTRLFGEYRRVVFSHLIIYDFFLPLTREANLRENLDNLFYSDAVDQRLREIPIEEIIGRFGRNAGESDEDVRRRVREAVGNVFFGYSISHVNGRFRAAELLSHKEAADRLQKHGSYLIDETTAVVRFIMRCEQSRSDWPSGGQLPLPCDGEASIHEAEQIEWIFFNLFAEAVVRQVRQEDEIWLLESGFRNRLVAWERTAEE